MKKRSPDEVKFNELEDGFLERFTDGDSDSEEEKIIQVEFKIDVYCDSFDIKVAGSHKKVLFNKYGVVDSILIKKNF